jgi:hypothetical protein
LFKIITCFQIQLEAVAVQLVEVLECLFVAAKLVCTVEFVELVAVAAASFHDHTYCCYYFAMVASLVALELALKQTQRYLVNSELIWMTAHKLHCHSADGSFDSFAEKFPMHKWDIVVVVAVAERNSALVALAEPSQPTLWVAFEGLVEHWMTKSKELIIFHRELLL